MNKRKLLFAIVFIITVFIILNILSYRQSIPPAQKFRLAVFPLTNHGFDQNWLLQAIPEMISSKLYRSLKDRAVVAPIEWTYKILANDSLNNKKYLTNFCEHCEFTHYFHGELSKVDDKFLLNYELQAINRTCISETISFPIEQLLQTIEAITQKVLGYFSFPGSAIIQPQYSPSIQALNYYIKGYRLFLEGNYPTALDNLSDAISIDSSFAEAYSLSARSHFAMGVEKRLKNASDAIFDFKKTKYFLTKAIRLDSTNDDNYRLMGEYYIYNERWSQADIMLHKAFKLNRNNHKIYIPLSNLHNFRYKSLGFRNEEQLFNRSVYINPFFEKGYLLLSDYLLFQNKRTQAVKILEKFLSINPNSVPALMALGKIYIVRNEMSNIKDVFNKVIELDPDHSDAYYNLGILYYNSNDYKNASRLFNRAIAIDNHLNSYLYLAYISELEGDLDKAIEYLRKRVHFKTGSDDEFAEEARKHLFKLIQSDSTKRKEMESRINKGSVI